MNQNGSVFVHSHKIEKEGWPVERQTSLTFYMHALCIPHIHIFHSHSNQIINMCSKSNCDDLFKSHVLKPDSKFNGLSVVAREPIYVDSHEPVLTGDAPHAVAPDQRGDG